MKFVEIIGAEFHNKGAHLMLLSVLESAAYGERDLEVTFCSRPHTGPFLDRAKHGLFQTVGENIPKLLLKVIGRADRRKRRRRLGVVLSNETAATFDASGLVFTERWGLEVLKGAVSRLERRAARGSKIILLPQAFGPFESERSTALMRRLVEVSTLIYTRDAESKEHLQQAAGESPKIVQSPDFTCLLKPDAVGAVDERPRNAVIVPNYRLVDQLDGVSEDSLAESLARTATHLMDLGYPVRFLNHEGEGDERLIAAAIARLPDGQVAVSQAAHPLEMKRELGQAGLVVSGRYHALVSALSQGIPSVALAWGHKYRALMDDFGCADFVVTNPSNPELICNQIDSLCAGREAVTASIARGCVDYERKAKEMWKRIFAEI